MLPDIAGTPEDIMDASSAPLVLGTRYRVAPRCKLTPVTDHPNQYY
jgi:hypothetical protein